jgi:hypothetical protein
VLLRRTGGHVVFLRMKVSCVDLDSFPFMRHFFLSQVCISYRAVCSLCVANVLYDVRTEVLNAVWPNANMAAIR